MSERQCDHEVVVFRWRDNLGWGWLCCSCGREMREISGFMPIPSPDEAKSASAEQGLPESRPPELENVSNLLKENERGCYANLGPQAILDDQYAKLQGLRLALASAVSYYTRLENRLKATEQGGALPTPAELREIADSIEEWADKRSQEVGANNLRALASSLERAPERRLTREQLLPVFHEVQHDHTLSFNVFIARLRELGIEVSE